MSARKPHHLLILGGTAEAAALARGALDGFGERLAVTTSLAGRTEQPGPLAGAVRIGGFGGAAGMVEFIADAGIDLLIDATHPFADQISRHAREAADQAQIPRLVLVRPPWRRHALDRWIEVGDVPGAASVLPRVGKRVFLTLGASELEAFARLADRFFLIRLIDPPREPPAFADCEVVLGRGPFTVAGERQLMRRHGIDVLVAKASGGAATEAKIIAARELSLPVVMVRRPLPERGERVDSVEGALVWLRRRLALLDRQLRTVSSET
jgi:precorrin-6A/cobalt-precorrin-6A reductase